MRCRGCEYELWNLAPGACPECGLPWTFEERRFQPNAAQFLCPHCEHAYSGSDDAGLPVPRQFNCVECQQEVSLICMRALPAPGTDGAQAMADVHPWLRRARVGRVRSFRRTTIEALLRPTNLGAALAPQVALRDALTYSMFCGSLGVLGGVGAPFAFIMFLNTGWRNMTSLLQSTAILFGVTLAAVVLFQCGLLLWGCAAHLLLRATGPVVRPWKTTASAILYCSAPLVFSALPCCCVYIFCVSLVWMMISALFAVVGAQRVSAGRAAFAVLCPSVLLLGSIIAVFFWAFVTVALGGINLPSPANPSQQSSQQSSLFAPADPSQGPAPTLSDPQSLPAP